MSSNNKLSIKITEQFITRRELRKQNPSGPIVFIYVLIVVPGTYFDVLKTPNNIRLFEFLKMLYPLKGAAKAEPVWGPIVFT